MVIKEIDFKKTAVVPMYEQIALTLKKSIIKNQFSSGDKLPPEPKMALQFGVSRPTLRKSLKLLEEQNLIAQRKGRGTFVTYREVPKRRIALVVGSDIHDVHDSYTLRILAALNFALQANSNNELLVLDNNKETSILQKFHASRSDGMICISDSSEIIKKLLKPEFKNIPMVFLNNRNMELKQYGFASVSSNPRAIDTAVAHLAKLGHRRVAYMAASNDFSDLKLRNEEFLEVRGKYGLDLDPSLYLEYKESPQLWYDQVRENVRELCSRKNIPTAIVCPNACNTYGAWQGIMDCHLRIPEDISIIGVDCRSQFNPHLSTISQAVTEMAEAAEKLIIDMFNKNKLIQKELIFDVKLEERGSCAPPRKNLVLK
jgi:GntR family transcriptional regulator, arabinose operon transcriptional repressor